MWLIWTFLVRYLYLVWKIKGKVLYSWILVNIDDWKKGGTGVTLKKTSQLKIVGLGRGFSRTGIRERRCSLEDCGVS
jgi:hypothetical protein